MKNKKVILMILVIVIFLCGIVLVCNIPTFFRDYSNNTLMGITFSILVLSSIVLKLVE